MDDFAALGTLAVLIASAFLLLQLCVSLSR